MLNQHLQSPVLETPIQITIIGFGNIGRQILALLLEEKYRSYHINIIDPSPSIRGSIYDLLPSGNLRKIHQVYFNNQNHFFDADFIFYCAGKAIPKGENRQFGIEENVEMVNTVFKGYTPFKLPLILVISNPQEQLCQAIFQASSLPYAQIIGLGTLVDSLRFEYYLAEKASVASCNVSAWVIGEHGNHIVPVISHSVINHHPLEETLSKADIQACIDATRNTPNFIKETQSASYFTASKAAIFIMHAYYSMYQEVLALCVYQSALNIYASVPVKIGKSQVNIIRDFKLTNDEQEEFNRSLSFIAEQSDSYGFLTTVKA